MPSDPEGISRLTHHFANGEVSFGCGIDLYITGAQTIDSLNTLCSDAGTLIIEELLPLLSVGIELMSFSVRYAGDLGEIVGTATIEDGGGASGTALPANVAIVAGGSDGTVYRGGKGRTYWGLVPESALASAKAFSAEYVGDFETAWDGYITGLSALTPAGSTCTAGVVHRVRGGVAISPTFGPYVSTHVQKRVCTQRRRTGALL
jgi:hypothetical protein